MTPVFDPATVALQSYLESLLAPIRTRLEVLDERSWHITRRMDSCESRQTEQARRATALESSMANVRLEADKRRAAKEERRKMRGEAIATVNWGVTLILIGGWAFGLIDGEKARSIINQLSALARASL